MEFHVSHASRLKYGFTSDLFSYNGNVIFANFQSAREFAQKINTVRLQEGDLPPVYAGMLNALGLIDEIMHHVIQLYREELKPDFNQAAYDWVAGKIGDEALERTLAAFCQEFPPLDVVEGNLTVEAYLSAKNPDGFENRYETLEELLVLWITNQNPAAMKPFGELFDDQNLVEATAYPELINGLKEFCETLPQVEGMSLIAFLCLPSQMFPDSLFDQIDFIRRRWGDRLGPILRRLLTSLDCMKEEAHQHGLGPGPVEIPVYPDDDEMAEGMGEYEAFSKDQAWMPRLVLIAKNTYVWMDQLSKKYGWRISKLDQIPDEELFALREHGFTGLWLIGLWERSHASAKIKQYCGNPEAIASAYSLADYRIADDLGGEEAYRTLKHRAWRYGVRLASDMVPNHMGIDSGWVLYQPDRFLALRHSPYPSYTFNGPNLSPDPNIGIYLEDHYYTREDAAVVFQRVDFNRNDVRYIYHGNDGTSMPWNDTAQLNYLDPAVREAVIQTILDVARRFPIIRFDAAMTLAKKHYQRLWFPEPGTGGDIATRSEYGMSKADFDAAFPEEFWREVVDRVAVEAPDTLLLAEAFWLMEGYFVRTLGMHRVYNSAFMNLLRNEDNIQFRILLKSTLEYDPDILKRYVNFMNNPDEKTAVEQFGKGDKYFGICVLMCTLPGLPMFGHGQLEGFTEKYGMEYQRAYYDEQVDQDLFARHEREIFPLLHKRRCFAEVDHFVLYNFATSYGNIDENVYAYSNYGEGQHSLVVYNNRMGDARGYVRQSVPFVIKRDGEKIPRQVSLAESLQLHDRYEYFIVLHDSIRGLYYLRPSTQIWEEGLYLQLNGYEYFVFDEIYEVQDDAGGNWRQLCDWLAGKGTADLHEAMDELILHTVLIPYRNCFDGHKLRWLHEQIGSEKPYDWEEIRNGTWNDFKRLYDAAGAFYQVQREDEILYDRYLFSIGEFLGSPLENKVVGMKSYNEQLEHISVLIQENPAIWSVIYVGLQQKLLIENPAEPEKPLTWTLADDWSLRKTQTRLLTDANWDDLAVDDQVLMIQWVSAAAELLHESQGGQTDRLLNQLLDLAETRHLLKTNVYDGIHWFNKEAGEKFGILLEMIGYYLNNFDENSSADKRAVSVMAMKKIAATFLENAALSEYHYARLYMPEPQKDASDPALGETDHDNVERDHGASEVNRAGTDQPVVKEDLAERDNAEKSGAGETDQ